MEKHQGKRTKDKRAEHENAEKKLQSLYEKRDDLNEEAKTYREERNQLTQEKQRLFAKIDALKVQREQAFQVLNVHKSKRDNYQSLAKGLIRTRQARDGNAFPALVKEVATLRTSIKETEWSQQTRPMSITDERDLIEKLKQKKDELKEKEEALAKQQQLRGDLDELNTNITEIFAKADEEHVLVQKHYTDATAYKKEMDELFLKIKDLSEMADKSHKKFVKCRERADEYHQKAMEMRQEVMSYRQVAREERQKAKELINQQNKQVKKVLEDKNKLEEAAEESLKSLLKQGKIKL